MKTHRSAKRIVLVLTWLATAPHLALACPVCFSQANESVLEAYYLSAAMLIALPILLLTAIGTWLFRSSRSTPRAAPRALEGAGAEGRGT